MSKKIKGVANDDYVIYLIEKPEGELEFVKTMKGLEGIIYSGEDYSSAVSLAEEALSCNLEDIEYLY